jgi:ribose transport system substrate-binding protein
MTCVGHRLLTTGNPSTIMPTPTGDFRQGAVTMFRARLSVLFAALLIVLSLGGSAFGTATSSAQTATPVAGGPPVNLAFFMASAANSYAQAQLEGVEEVAASMNATVDTFDGQFDSQRQYSQLQDAIASGRFDGFIVSPNDGNALAPVIEEAIAEGIVVGCVLAPCGPSFDTLEPQIEGQLIYAGIPFKQNGADIAEIVVQACEGKDPCQVAYIPGLPELPLESARLEGFQGVINQHDNIELTVTSAGQYLAETALPVAQDVLQANPDINVIASSGDQMIVGAEQAVEDAGLTGQVALVGNGGSEIAVTAVREGRWFGTAAAYPRSEGEVATDYVIRAIRGEELEPIGLGSPDLSEGFGPIVTQENADEFEPEWQG